jgi:hypothetical protein
LSSLVLPPPTAFAPSSAHLVLAALGTTFIRLHDPGTKRWPGDALRYGDSPGSGRFDHHEVGLNRGIIYLGVNLQHPGSACGPVPWELVASVAETVPHVVSAVVARDLLSRELVAGELIRDVELVDLTGPLLSDLGTGSLLTAEPERPPTQSWARWLHSHFSTSDGLYWHSAKQTRLDAICLTERGADAFAVRRTRKLSDPSVLPELLAALDAAGVRPTPDAALVFRSVL